MTDLRAAAQQALEALKLSTPKTRRADDDYAEQGWKEHNAAITALRAALAKPMKPLAEWQINDLIADIDPEDVCSWSFRQGVYAAEKHHGIKP